MSSTTNFDGRVWDTPERDDMSDAEEPIPAAACGYARAVAALRDDERYRHWWSADGAWQHKPTGRYWDADARGHLADYLETINQPLPRGDVQ